METQEIKTITIEEDKQLRKAELAKYLKCDISEIEDSRYDETTFEYGNKEYMVLDNEEATNSTKNCIRESLWAFNASFLVDYLPEGFDEEIIKMMQAKCEDSNEQFINLVGNKFDELCEDAIAADGRGHFRNTYDGKENESGEYFIYRMN